MTRNILLTIAYDGSGFHGWQRQPGERTVQGELEKVLSHTLGQNITIEGTSRTDAGVHALGQRASFKSNINIPIDKLPMIINNSLSQGKIFNERIPGEIKIISAEEMSPDFHARYNAVGKKYEYRIIASPEKDIFKRKYYYQIMEFPDIESMRKASSYIVGTHDFKSFETAGGTERETTVRTIDKIDIIDGEEKDEIVIEISGDGFLYNMVRIIVGTLVEIGMGKIQPTTMKDILSATDREKAGHTAPPTGLYLVEVYYNGSEITNS